MGSSSASRVRKVTRVLMGTEPSPEKEALVRILDRWHCLAPDKSLWGDWELTIAGGDGSLSDFFYEVQKETAFPHLQGCAIKAELSEGDIIVRVSEDLGNGFDLVFSDHTNPNGIRTVDEMVMWFRGIGKLVDLVKRRAGMVVAGKPWPGGKK